ncbi:hypothetical protein AAMO2058_000439900 [Amorphochlora amoebiformis]
MQGTLVGAMWMAMALAWPSVSKLRPRTPFIQRYGGIFRAHQKPSLVRKPSLVPKPYARKDIYELFGEADEDAASDPALLPADFDFSGLDTHDLNADKEGRMKDDEKSVLALSRKEAEELLRLKDGGTSEQVVSVNLGKDIVDPSCIHLDKKKMRVTLSTTLESVDIKWKDLASMAKKGKHNAYQCFSSGRKPEKISVFSETTQRPLTLMPSEDFNPNQEGSSLSSNFRRERRILTPPRTPPTLVIGGFTMHRIKNADPMSDTYNKIATFSKTSLKGKALDICTGLGYTAIEMAKKPYVESVLTLELDPSVLEICRCNPWSANLFENPKISTRIGNAADIIQELESESFSLICHDPPAQALTFAGELYSLDFYSNLYRILKKGGSLFHYVGNPASKESGTLFAGIMRRLQDAGFRNVRKSPKAFGISADK